MSSKKKNALARFGDWFSGKKPAATTTLWQAPGPGGGGWGSMQAYTKASQQWDPNGPPVELPIYGQPPTTFVKAVNATLLQLEQGAFYQSAYLWDGMTRDDRVAATMGQRIDRLIGSPLELEPPDAKNEAQQKIADDCLKRIKVIAPMSQTYRLLNNGLGLSVGIGQVLTERTPKGSTPTFKVWNNRFLRYDQLLRAYCLVTENRGEIVLDPLDPEWIIYEPYGPKGWLNGALIRSIAQPWIIRYWTRKWWARYQEVCGQPTRLGILPADRTPKDEARFLSEISTLAHEAVVRLPQGAQEGNKFDLKLLEATSTNWQGFKELLQHCDDSIDIAILGQRQSTQGQGGLGAKENAGESTLTKITRKDALIGDLLREKLLMPWTQDNYGNVDDTPEMEWQHEPPEDEKSASETDKNVGAALQSFKACAAPVDVREYLSQRGYPLLSPADVAKLELQAQADKQQQMAHELSLKGADAANVPEKKKAS